MKFVAGEDANWHEAVNQLRVEIQLRTVGNQHRILNRMLDLVEWIVSAVDDLESAP